MTDPIIQLRGVLEARAGETPHDAARRLRKERDEAVAAPCAYCDGGTMLLAADERSALTGNVVLLEASVARLTRERDEAEKRWSDLYTRATIDANVRRRLEAQIAAEPDERVRAAEGRCEHFLSQAQEAHDQRQHATRHMMKAREERDAMAAQLASLRAALEATR